MLNTVVRFFVLMTVLAGCAHRGAVRVECDGALRPINPKEQLRESPVSVAPASSNAPTRDEGRP
jgi:hypothetical protein